MRAIVLLCLLVMACGTEAEQMTDTRDVAVDSVVIDLLVDNVVPNVESRSGWRQAWFRRWTWHTADSVTVCVGMDEVRHDFARLTWGRTYTLRRTSTGWALAHTTANWGDALASGRSRSAARSLAGRCY
jgi:hypothetical protein